MVLIYSIIITFILAILLNKQIKKHSNIIYVITILLSIVFIIFYKAEFYKVYEDIGKFLFSPLKRGTVSLALFTIVMYTGVLNKKWKISKILFSIRGELSIIACILTLGHNILYGMNWFVKLFLDPSSLEPLKLLATILSLIMILLMLPLMITSFPVVRKKLKFKTWKNIQRLSYIFYGLIYIHIICLFIPKINKGKLSDIIIYGVIMGGYYILRIARYYKDKNKSKL